MKRTTAKTIVQALQWIDTTAHFEISWHWAKGRSRETGCYEFGDETHMKLRGPLETLLIPNAMFAQIGSVYSKRLLIKPNTRPFDTRFYMLTPAGRRYLKRI